MEHEALKKIGDVAELLGTTPRTLRFYEEEGLISARRTSGGTRYYSAADITRCQAILHLVHVGIPLAIVKTLATTRSNCTTGAESSQQIHAALKNLHAQVDTQISVLTHLKNEVEFASTSLESCFHCANPPTRSGCPQCPVNQHATISELLNLIWEQEVHDNI
jgi:DNA-binding transcriptional MerR regulator